MTVKYQPDVLHQEAMAGYLIESVVRDGTGESDGDRCVGEPPSARYYLSSLAPKDLNLAAGRERRGRETPSSLGFEFEVTDPRAALTLRATVSCYYKVWPTLAEQRDFSNWSPGDTTPFRLAPVFVRREVSTGEMTGHLDPDKPYVASIGASRFAQGFAAVAAVAASDPVVERRPGEDRTEIMVPADVLASEDIFLAWLRRVVGKPVTPSWEAGITLMTRRVQGGRWRVVIALNNASQDPTVAVQRPRKNGPKRRHDDSRDHFLFRARLEVSAAAGVIVPIDMNLGPDAYRYDPRLVAYANNCGVDAEMGGEADPRPVRIWTVPAPVHTTHRAEAAEHESCGFDRLARDPISALRALSKSLASYVDDTDWDASSLPAELAARKEEDRRGFGLEVARFDDGIRWLEKDPRLLLAFRLANRAMIELGRRSRRSHRSWRLFQLVFIVSQLPALAWREHTPEAFTPGLWGGHDGRDPTAAATVLWYPTGGGKTEAYLGLMACAMFYDRARGKRRGVTAWCRLPLRMLALQQTQRQLQLVAAADEVRLDPAVAKELAAVGGDPGGRFAIGFFAGENNTPNSLSRDKQTIPRLIADAERRRALRLTDECPYCTARAVEIEPPDPVEIRLVHRCTSCLKELPLHIVDTEVYRYLPTIVVGTLDKLATIGLSDRFGALFGDVDCECPQHGFGRGMKCHERRLTGHPKNNVIPLRSALYDASPTLEIVDELHMVRENLGAFSGHYEGLLAHVQADLSRRGRPDGRAMRMKVVATTATIRGEDRQCDHLFGLNSVVFPLPGPTLERSFYWRIDHDKPLRRFVGVMPSRQTAEQTMVRILQSLHAAIQHVATDGGWRAVPGLADLAPDEAAALADLYKVSLTYVTSHIDFGKIRRSMDTQINEWLTGRGLDRISVRELSSHVDLDHTRATLDDLEGSPGTTDAVLATSMVSHGVDVNRLNLMVFNGMPKAMSEYIQASSRVGRRYLGIVFILFNPLRERDRSHFRYHSKFHEYLDRMVEPVAINRWSRFAARRTLPGVFMGHVLQSVNRDWWDSGHAPNHLHDLDSMQAALRAPERGGLPAAQPERLVEAISAIYQADRDEAAELREEIARSVRAAASTVRSAGAGATAASGTWGGYRPTGDYLGLEYDPMNSLRDVAEGLPFITVEERKRS